MDVGSGGEHKRLEVDQPILSNIDLEKIRRIEDVDGSFRTYTLDITYRIDGDEAETDGSGGRTDLFGSAEGRRKPGL